jgi:hypothetical protein
MASSPESGSMDMLTSPKAAQTTLELNPARVKPRTRNYGDSAAARGIVIGIAISALLWAAIIAALI